MEENDRGPSWVAKQTGYTREWISTVLNGRKDLSDGAARRLSEALGIDFAAPAARTENGVDRDTAQREIAINPEPRCPCVLLLDAALRSDPRLKAGLAAGFEALGAELRRDRLLARRVEVAAIALGKVPLRLSGFTGGDDLAGRAQGMLEREDWPAGAPRLVAGIATSLEFLDSRRRDYEALWVDSYRPWLVVLLASAPARERGDFGEALAEIERRERAGFVSFFAAGVGGRDMPWLRGTGLRPPLALSAEKLARFFAWTTAGLRRVTSSVPGERVLLPDIQAFLKG
jgi:uncharacterized protein YegL